MWKALVNEFSENCTIKRHGELPNNYNLGVTKGKVLITLTPTEGKKSDVNYVRSWEREGFEFINEEEFYKLDVGKNGEPLTRLPLYMTT